MSLTEPIRLDWDARARKDAFDYIASWRTDWDPSGFRESGKEGYRPMVARRTAVSATRVADVVRGPGRTVLEMWDERTPLAWCCPRKGSQRAEAGIGR